ncbi:MAG TPA: heme-binding protein [Methylophilaceae bacterium]|nr:heme-binding protein [Methylophilaceae bacterium]
MVRSVLNIVLFSCLVACSKFAQAEADGYGPSVSLETAKQVATSAAEMARKQNFRVAIAIVDTAGNLVYFEKLDDTQTASVEVAIAKARSAGTYRRETKVFETALSNGRTAILGLPGAVPIEGGIPLVREGKVIGAIGVSGVTSEQDGQVARAGADRLAQ